MGAFGEKLRQQREQRNLSLDAISNTTKISARMLRALEDEHFDQLPGGVFNKGFVRAYARQVGLDEEETLTDYLTALRESQIQQQNIRPDFGSSRKTASTIFPGGNGDLELAERRRRERRNQDRRNQDRRNQERRDQHRQPELHGEARHGEDRHRESRHTEDRHHEDRPLADRQPEFRHLEQSADVQPEHSGHELEERSHNVEFLPVPDRPHYPSGEAFAHPLADPSNRVPWKKLSVALLLVAASLAVWNLYRHRRTTAPPQRASIQTESAPSALAPTQLSVPTASTIAGHASPAVTSKPAPPPILGASAPTPSKSITHPSVPKPPATFTILIRAEKTTWVSILADGNPVAQETLIAPASTSVRATREVVVKTANASGVSFLLNGKLISAPGNDGEAKTYVFDATGLREKPQAQPDTNR